MTINLSKIIKSFSAQSVQRLHRTQNWIDGQNTMPLLASNIETERGPITVFSKVCGPYFIVEGMPFEKGDTTGLPEVQEIIDDDVPSLLSRGFLSRDQRERRNTLTVLNNNMVNATMRIVEGLSEDFLMQRDLLKLKLKLLEQEGNIVLCDIEELEERTRLFLDEYTLRFKGHIYMADAEEKKYLFLRGHELIELLQLLNEGYYIDKPFCPEEEEQMEITMPRKQIFFLGAKNAYVFGEA